MYTLIIMKANNLTHEMYKTEEEAIREANKVEECNCLTCQTIQWTILVDYEGDMVGTWRRSDDRFLQMSMHHFA